MKPASYQKSAGNYGNLESTCYTLHVRLTDTSMTLFSYYFKAFSFICQTLNLIKVTTDISNNKSCKTKSHFVI